MLNSKIQKFITILLIILVAIPITLTAQAGPIPFRGRRIRPTNADMSELLSKINKANSLIRRTRKYQYRRAITSLRRSYNIIQRWRKQRKYRPALKHYNKTMNDVNGLLEKLQVSNVRPTDDQMSALIKKINRANRIMRRKRAFRYRNQIRDLSKDYNRIQRLRSRRRYNRAERRYSRTYREVNDLLDKLRDFQRARRLTRREIRSLNAKIERAEDMMEKKNAFRYRRKIRMMKNNFRRIKTYNRRRRYRIARKEYEKLDKEVDSLLNTLSRIRFRRIRNARRVSDPRPEVKIRMTYEKNLRGYRRRFDRIRRRERADYNFRIRRLRRRNIDRAYLHLYLREKRNSRRTKIRIKVNGRKVFEGDPKLRRRRKIWVITLPDNVLRRRNVVRVVVLRPRRNYYIDIYKIKLVVVTNR